MESWKTPIEVSSAVLLLIQFLLVWALWSLRKQFMSREGCDERCKKLEKRQGDLEAAHKAMPSPGDMGAIKDRLGKIEGGVESLAATVEGQKEIMLRIERPLNLLIEHHLKGSG